MADEKLGHLKIYQLYVTLQDIRPLIFRRVVVPSSFTLRKLHCLLQAAFGWGMCHLHAFRDQEDITYGSPSLEPFPMNMGEEDIDDSSVQLDAVLRAEGDYLIYEYDFGDGWEHEIILEEITVPKAQGVYPAVIDGARNGPPEDCGGPFGYAELMEIVRRQRQGKSLNEEEEEQLEWLGDYDPEAFNLDAVNRSIPIYSTLD